MLIPPEYLALMFLAGVVMYIQVENSEKKFTKPNGKRAFRLTSKKSVIKARIALVLIFFSGITFFVGLVNLLLF